MSAADPKLLNKIIKSLSPSSKEGEPTNASLLAAAAVSYASRPIADDITIPTGFDPQAAALFEAVIEAAYLVANADGEFDEDERRAFQTVVQKACGLDGLERQVQALIDDLADLIEEDGFDKRIEMVARAVKKPEQHLEVLRVAALLAHISGGVSPHERDVLDKLASGFSLPPTAVDEALLLVGQALGG